MFLRNAYRFLFLDEKLPCRSPMRQLLIHVVHPSIGDQHKTSSNFKYIEEFLCQNDKYPTKFFDIFFYKFAFDTRICSMK